MRCSPVLCASTLVVEDLMTTRGATTTHYPRNSKQIGKAGEELAAHYLTEQGYQLLARNWRNPHGELDLIVAYKDTVVAVEVKTRSGHNYGPPLAAVTATKLRRIRRLLGAWLAQQHGSWRSCRIDAIGITLREGQRPKIEHIAGLR